MISINIHRAREIKNKIVISFWKEASKLFEIINRLITRNIIKNRNYCIKFIRA